MTALNQSHLADPTFINAYVGQYSGTHLQLNRRLQRTRVHNVKRLFQKRTELSAATTLKGKTAQTPSNKASALESNKTNTTNISMLDITGSAHTVSITTDGALRLVAAKPSPIRIGYIFSTIEIGTVGLLSANAARLREVGGVYVTYT